MTLRRTLVDFESVLFSIPVNSFYEATENKLQGSGMAVSKKID